MDKNTYIQLDRIEHKIDIILQKYEIILDEYGNPIQEQPTRIKNKKVTE